MDSLFNSFPFTNPLFAPTIPNLKMPRNFCGKISFSLGDRKRENIIPSKIKEKATNDFSFIICCE
uniref:Uncharacterized protein n=1 Tax=Parascaris univalens TaxID=6257 RepID=A0A914ZKK7_PARUN